MDDKPLGVEFEEADTASTTYRAQRQITWMSRLIIKTGITSSEKVAQVILACIALGFFALSAVITLYALGI